MVNSYLRGSSKCTDRCRNLIAYAYSVDCFTWISLPGLVCVRELAYLNEPGVLTGDVIHLSGTKTSRRTGGDGPWLCGHTPAASGDNDQHQPESRHHSTPRVVVRFTWWCHDMTSSPAELFIATYRKGSLWFSSCCSVLAIVMETRQLLLCWSC